MMDLVAAGLDELHERIGGRFARAEPRARVREYVSGLVTGLERKNGWTLAEWADEVSPDGMQRLLRRADWDVDGVRDDVRAYVVEQLGDEDGVLIADDTGFLKKGTRSAGVQRQYSGTAGRTENCQVGVFLAYASRFGHALIDRELYLPRSWTDDPGRCRAAGIPEEAEFTTKPRQAQAMIARAVAAGVPSRRGPGRRSRPGPGRMARASTTGPGSRSAPAARAAGDIGCWPAGRSATRPRSPTTPATGPAGPVPRTWHGPRAAAGISRSACSRRRARPGSISTRSAPGGPGMPTSPCPCSRWPGFRAARPRPKKRARHR